MFLKILRVLSELLTSLPLRSLSSGVSPEPSETLRSEQNSDLGEEAGLSLLLGRVQVSKAVIG